MIVAHTDFDNMEGMKKPVQIASKRVCENVTELLTTLSEIQEKLCTIETTLFGERPCGETLRPVVDCLEAGIYNSLDAAREINGKLGTIMDRL